ncbi:MAG: GAF domain-containing protein [Chloroflexi bacterium]|nr:GAF domain-containing protein [Chloroflexota bacterium]
MDIIELSMKLGSAYRTQQPVIFRQANLKQILQVAQAGQCGYVLGPRHSEKSDLLRAAAISIQEAGTHHASYFSLRDAALASEQNFFATLASDLLPVSEADFFAGLFLGLSRDLGNTAVTPIHPQTAAEFEGALLALVSQSDRPLALFIDDLEVAPPNLVAALLDVLERVYTAVSPHEKTHFQAIVCGALTFDQIAPQTVSRFQQIARLVWVDDLDPQERIALVQAACQRAGVTPTKDGVRALLQQTGGDQFLIQQVLKISFDLMQRMGKDRLTPARVAEAAERFLTMTPDPQLKEMLRQIESDPALLLSALRIMEEDRVSISNLPFANKPAPNLLDLCGIFRRDGKVYRCKSDLWQRLLRQNLDDARIGGLYAIAGYWHNAFDHLGKALRQGQTAVRSELFTATINAMHTRQSAAGAFDYLGEGLEALYPESDLHLYELKDDQLVCVYPGQAGKRLPLAERHQPEVQALHGSDYTIALVDQDLRLLIPLRAEEDEAHIVGLVSLGQLVSQVSPYQRREEVLQLIGFLGQAARVIQERGQYAALLRTAEKRASRMEKMLQMQEAINNQVTTSVKGLLNEIAYSARELFGADSAIIYPLRPDALPELVYEVDLIAASGLRYQIDTASRPRSPRGVAAQVVRMGCQIVPDVEKSVSDYGRTLSLKAVIVREKIRSFIGIRLGTELEPLGILYLNWQTYHTLAPDELTLLEIFLKYAAVALPSARRYQQLQDDLLLSRLELKGLDQTFYGNVHLRTEKEIDKAIKLTLHTTREYTDAPYQYLIRNEPFSSWRRYGLTDDGELYSEAQVDITGGIIEEAFKLSRPVSSRHVGKKSTGRLPQRYNEVARSALAVPVRVTGHCFAVLYLESRNPNGFTEDQQHHLERIATHLALTLEQSERARALDELLAVSQQLTREVDLESALLNLIKQAMGALATVDAITFYYEDRRSGRLMFGSVSGGQEQASIGEYFDDAPAIVNQVWKANLEVVAQNLDEMPELKQAFFSARALKSAVAFPLRVGEERVGCMFFGYSFHHRFGKAELNILHLFAQLASLAILRASLHDEAEQRRQHLEVVSRITPIISGSLGQDDIFPVVMENIVAAFPAADNACVVQRNEAADRLRTFVNADFYQAEELLRESGKFLENSPRRGIANRAIRLGQAINVPDVRLDPDYIPAIPTTRSELVAPVLVEGKSEYALVLESNRLGAFTADDQRLLEMLAEHVVIALQNQRQYQLARRREVSEHTAVLAAGLVHDIKSAVANIPDLVDELEEKIAAQTDYANPMSDLRRNAEVTGRLSGRLKDFVITENYDPQWIDLHKLIRGVLQNAQRGEPPHVNTSAIISDPLPEIWADDLTLELLLRNLLENAYAAIPEGREGMVQIVVEMMAGDVLIHVRDNGKGIARDKLDEIFEFGYSTKAEKGKMTGVGLFQCRRIAENHNGSLEVKTIPGLETVFTLKLPLNGRPSAG